jgi:FkbM family methyltransferase
MKIDDPNLAKFLMHEIFTTDCYKLKPLLGKPIDTIIDIGANNGFFAVYARVLFPTAKIVCFEPCPDTFARLSDNVANLNIECRNIGLGDGTPITMKRNSHTGDSGSFIGVAGGDIPTKTFTDLVADLSITANTIVKIDCEGGERFLVKSDEQCNTLAKAGRWMMEVHYSQKLWPGCPPREFYELFWHAFAAKYNFGMSGAYKRQYGLIVADKK